MANILIIGAGIAGLKAAFDLAQNGHEILILEARSRLGGRIYSKLTSDGTPIELGASFWEGKNTHPFYQTFLHQQTQLLPATATQIFSTYANADVYHCYEGEAVVTQRHIALQIFDEAIESGRSVGKTVAEVIQQCLTSKQLPVATLYWIRKWLEQEWRHHHTSLQLIGFPTFVYPPDPFELETWDAQTACFCLVQGGYSKIIAQLAMEVKNQGVTIKTNSPVLKIVDNKDLGVDIYTETECFKAQKVLCTIPIGVLKTQAPQLFSPPLSLEKQQAIATLGVHQAIRVNLEFAEAFWTNPLSPYLFIDIPGEEAWLEFRNNLPITNKAILQTDSYSHCGNLSDTLLVEKILQDLRKVYPQAPKPVTVDIYNWSTDRFAQGSYPYRTAKIDEKMQQALECPAGNIYFAGADYSRLGFSVHNGYVNGMQVAQQICDLFHI